MNEIEKMSELIDKEKKKTDQICIGLDLGTMNIVCARSDKNDIKIIRNVFLPVSKDDVSINELTDINYVSSDDGIFIIGDDAFKFANIFAKEVCRPMESGLISSKELYAIDVLTLMIQSLVGDIKDKECYCAYSIPAEAIDVARSVTYHEKIFSRILGNLSINNKPINEAMSIVYSECANEKFSGIGISYGAGMSNLALSFKGIEALKFSISRSGDWIDKQVAESLNMIPNRVTSIKEKSFDLEMGYLKESNKKKRRVLEALHYYYESLINYTIKKIIEEFNEKVDIEIDESIPIVLSGGTSMPKGFDGLFKEIISKYELPFEISEIRRAKNPMTAVANGLLVRALADIN